MKDKKQFSTLQKVGFIFLGVLFFNFLQGVFVALRTQNWNLLYSKITTLVIMGVLLYFLWDYITEGWANLKKRREEAKEQFEKQQGNINIKDAAIFSLAWSREIYKSIPHDRKALVQTSFVLIGIAGGIVMLHLGSYGFLTLLLIAGLTLAGVNLLIWVVGSERQEKDRMAIELEAARKMQLSLMPAHDPEIQGFDISGCCIPAKNVGGDMFDFVWSGKNHRKLCIPVVDVSGKGMDAALTAVYTSGALVSEAQHEENVVTVMDNLNSAIRSRENRSRFVSMLMVALDVSDRKIEYINAGQTKPLLLRDRQLSVLKGSGARFPLGVMKAPQYRIEALALRPGDTLLLYTDGVTEAMNADSELFGDQRFRELLLQMSVPDMRAADIVDAIRMAVMNFSGEEQQHDDLTIVVIKVI